MAEAPISVNSIVLFRGLVHSKRMRTRVLLVLGSILLAVACSPLSVYYKQGGSVERLKRDQLMCETRALNEAPVSTVVRQGPPRYYPGGRYCNGSGNCYRRGGFWVPGEVYSTDVNRSLRSRIEAQCMADRGYQPIEIQRCSQGTASASTDTSRSDVLPPLTENSCAIRYDDGSIEIISAG